MLLGELHALQEKDRRKRTMQMRKILYSAIVDKNIPE